MRIFGYLTAASWIVCLGLTTGADAAPLELKHVAADAAWLGHVDFDAMRESIVVQKAMEKHKHPGGAQMVKHMLGMDLEKDLHGMTCYGKQVGKHTGVMILHAKVDGKRLLGMANRFMKPEVTEYREHKLHRWTHKSRRSSKERQVAALFVEDKAIVLASSVEELKAAVDVLDGKASSLTKKSALAGNIPAGTTMLMRVSGVSAAAANHKSKLARQIESFRFVTGEHEGESFYRARTITTNAEVAGQLQEIVEGFRAVAQLHVGDNETGRRLVDDLRVKAKGAAVTVLWKGPAKDVWTMIEAHKKIFEEIKKKRSQNQNRYRGWSRSGNSDKDQTPDSADSAEEDF